MRCQCFVSASLIYLTLTSAATAQVHDALTFGAPDTGHIIDYGTFVISYDGRLRSARWAAERLTKESLGGNAERQDDFRPDRRIRSEFRSELSDYSGSGLDRGHLAPSANHLLSNEINSATFFLSNMSPQEGIGFNRHYWANLEAAIRDLALLDEIKEVYVFTGPLIMPDDAPPPGMATGRLSDIGDEDEFDESGADGQVLTVTYRYIGGNHVPVPTHYFKALLVVPQNVERSVKLFTLVLPNLRIPGDVPLDEFHRSVDYLEHWAGFDLWTELPDDVEDYKEGISWLPWIERL